jgi:hypothetical protein
MLWLRARAPDGCRDALTYHNNFVMFASAGVDYRLAHILLLL